MKCSALVLGILCEGEGSDLYTSFCAGAVLELLPTVISQCFFKYINLEVAEVV